jgi:tetratricopeptide (TPR) repeat protein
MLAHLGEHQGDRLRFLTGGPRDAPARQRTLRATIEWSYDLLNADEQRLFRQLSVFAGGCTLEAIEAVCPVTTDDGRRTTGLDVLQSLVDQSLLQVSQSTPPRFTMLETVREYALERLEEAGEAEAVRDQHAGYYAGALEGWGADLKGPRQLEALAEIEADLDNARAAWEWAVKCGPGQALDRQQIDWLDRALEGLYTFYEWRGRYEEGVVACQKAVEALGQPAPSVSPSVGDEVGMRVMACALAWQGRFGRLLGQYELADRSLKRAIALLDSPELSGQEAQRAFILFCMAERIAATDFHRASRLAECSLALYRTLGARWGMAKALLLLGAVARSLGDPSKTRQSYEESLVLHRALGDRRGIAWSLIRIGLSAGDTGQIEKGERLAREAIAIARELGDAGLVRAASRILSHLLHDGGRFAEAVAAKEQVLAMCRDQGILAEVAGTMVDAGLSARHQGGYDRARALVRAALPVLRESRDRTNIVYCQLELGRLALAEGAYEEADDWLQQGLATLEGFEGHYLLQEGLAALTYVARGRGQHARARGHLRAALRPTLESGYLNAALQSLPAMALLLADGGEVEQAVELYALVSRFPYAVHSRWFEDVAGREITAAAEALPPEVVAAAQERGRARDLWATVEELLDELGGTPSG